MGNVEDGRAGRRVRSGRLLQRRPWSVWQRGEGPRNISVVAKARVAASERGVPWSAARMHHARVVPLATRWAQERQMVVPWRAARVHHARVMPLATRWAQERQMVCGSGVKSTGAVKSSAPARYWPIMKMRAAVTGTEQSALIWPSMADRAEPVACQRGRPGGAGGVRADGGEAVEVRKHEGLAEGPNEEDGRHGL